MVSTTYVIGRSLNLIVSFSRRPKRAPALNLTAAKGAIIAASTPCARMLRPDRVRFAWLLLHSEQKAVDEAVTERVDQ